MTLRLLLVDDDPGLRALLRATLDAVDVEVDEAEDVPSALAAIRRRRPDAIVLDVNLPGMDGLAFSRQLKRDRATKDVPIVVLSGSDGGTSEAALDAGADSFLSKPFSPLELLAIVERLSGGLHGIPFRAAKKREPQEQLLLYARDLRHLLGAGPPWNQTPEFLHSPIALLCWHTPRSCAIIKMSGTMS